MRLTRREFLAAGGALVAGAGAFGGWRASERLKTASRRALLVAAAEGIPDAGSGGSLDFLVAGDTGYASDVREKVAAAMFRICARVRPELVVLTGDNAYPRGFSSARDPAWKRQFEDPFGELAAVAPFYPCLGNHDHQGDVAAQIEYGATHDRWRLPAAQHAFEVSAPGDDGAGGACSAAFFVLDTTPIRLAGVSPFRRPPEVDWLEDALRRSEADWKVVVGHHPVFSAGPKGGSSTLLWYLSPLFARYEVDFYLSGHDHDLELIDPQRGWLQVVSGAGSTPEESLRPLEDSLFSSTDGGFAWLSLRNDRAWVRFQSARGPLACFRVERGPCARTTGGSA
jgi:tartrate-resistant acid phosphatase type 5